MIWESLTVSREPFCRETLHIINPWQVVPTVLRHGTSRDTAGNGSHISRKYGGLIHGRYRGCHRHRKNET